MSKYNNAAGESDVMVCFLLLPENTYNFKIKIPKKKLPTSIPYDVY